MNPTDAEYSCVFICDGQDAVQKTKQRIQIVKKPADLVRSAGKLEVKITFKENLANDAADSIRQRFHHGQNLRNFLSIEQR
jgi:hypothetical protein